MTDNRIEKIRAEIERVKKNQEGVFTSYTDGKFDLCEHLLSFIDSMQEEPKECMYSTANFTNADRLTLCKDCKELCRYNQKTAAESLGISQEAYDEIVDKCLYGSEVELVNNGDLPKEEPVSEDLEEEIGNYIENNFFGSETMGFFSNKTKEELNDKDVADIARHFAEWQKQKDANLIFNAKEDGYRLGLATMKQQMMAKAVDATVHIDAGGYPYIPQMELYDYGKDIPLAKEGDKYKVILIKEG